MAKAIYLDYAAATPLDPEVLKAMEPFFTQWFYNPSASYLAAKDVRQELGNARSTVAGWLGAKPAEVTFTAGATEANNLVISGVMSQFPDGELLVSSIEHDSVLAPAELFNSKQIPVDRQATIELPALNKMITSKTVLVSLMLVNNELGSIQPLREVSQLLAKHRAERQKKANPKPLYLHTDAAQAPNYFDIHISRLGVDMMSLNGGKIYGPKQSGALFIKTGVVLKPLILGGGQESGLRSGTENVAGSVGLAKALDIAQNSRPTQTARIKKLKDIFMDELDKKIPKLVINGSHKNSAPHILNISLPGFDNERLMMELDEQGIQCAVGSACSADSGEPSHVLKAIGMTDELARSSLRFSFGKQTTEVDIKRSAQTLQRLTGR